MATPVDKTLQKPIWNKMEEELDPLNRVEDFLKQRNQSSFLMFNDEHEYLFVMNIILSSLKLYQEQIKTLHYDAHHHFLEI